MNARTLSLSIAIAAAALPLPACESSSSMVTQAANLLQQLDGEWVLQQLGGQDVASMLPPGSKQPTLNFSPDGSISGFGGVNRLMTKAEPADLMSGKLDLSRLASTLMAGPAPAMDVENKYVSALRQSRSLSIDKSGALNLSDGAKTLLHFTKARP